MCEREREERREGESSVLVEEEPEQLAPCSGEAGDGTLPVLPHIVVDAGVTEDIARGGEGCGVHPFPGTQRTQGGVRGHLDTAWMSLECQPRTSNHTTSLQRTL